MEKRIETAWCPGCGNFAIRDVLERVIGELPVPRSRIVMTSGIGQAAKMPQYLEVNYFNGLHGRSLPLAVGIKLARPDLTVIAYSGDGCMYGEGGNHFIQTLRKGLDLTVLVSENRVYALTKGQSSPTSDLAAVNDLSPGGNPNVPLNPLALAVTMGAPFVARGFAGDKEHLAALIREAILFPGTAVVDILQPCVSFNRVNTYAWYRERVYRLETPPADRQEALRMAESAGERIPLGVIYRNDSAPRRPARELFEVPLTGRDVAARLSRRCVMMR
jgi:2-oxoglutarate ferredoxin oxidoreductase subunit beta